MRVVGIDCEIEAPSQIESTTLEAGVCQLTWKVRGTHAEALRNSMRACQLPGLSLQTTSPLLHASRSTFASTTSRTLLKSQPSRIIVTSRPRHNWPLLNHRLPTRPSSSPSPFGGSSTQTITMDQTRGHFGHSHHGHHHHHDTTFLTSTDKNDAGVRITRVGLFVNLGMAIAKGVGGYVFNSKA